MKRLLLIGTGVLVAVALLEIAVRAMMPQTLGPAIFEPGDEGFGQLKRSAEVRLSGPEYDVRIRTNSNGLRDVEHEYAKRPGIFRVLVVGDSFTMGAGVDLEDTYAKRAEQSLNRDAGGAYEVINAGVQGWGTGEQLIFVKKEWLRYEPDLVVLAFQETDFTDNLNHHVWELRSGQLQRLPVRKTEPSGSFIARVPGYRWTVTHSQAAVYARNTFFKMVSARAASEGRQAVAQQGGTNEEADQYAWQLTGTLLSEMRRVIAGRRIPFAIVYVPNAADVRTFSRSRSAGEVEHFVERFASSNAVPFMTLTPALAVADADSVYYPRDGHWNSRGHEIAAAAVARLIRTLHG